MPDNNNITPNASTYKQVVQNQQDIADLRNEIGGEGGESGSIKEQISDINKNIDTINEVVGKMSEGMDATATGDVCGKFPDLKVIGIHANTDKVNENTPPSGYKRDITYEIKSTDAIGLTGKEGVTGPYCLMVTTTIASQVNETDIDFKSFRMAYGNSLKRFYSEAKDGVDEWNEWVEDKTQNPHAKTNIITSDTQPADDAQIEGDLWFEELPNGG